MADERNAPTTYELTPGDAGLAAEILLRLADLVDGAGGPTSEKFRLSETQLQLLSKPATRFSRDPAHTAQRLRDVSARLEQQLPPHAGAILH